MRTECSLYASVDVVYGSNPSALLGMFVVSANHSRLIAHNCVVSSSMRRHDLHSLLYRCIDETVTMNNSETAEVQGEATARREQCEYIVHNLLHLD